MALDPNEIGAYIFGIIMGGAAAFERWRNHKKEKKTEEDTELVSDAKVYQTRANLMQKAADDYAALYERERNEHQKTRQFWHDKSGEFQVTLGACQEKLTDFQNKPDYAAILELIRQQAATSVDILSEIKQIRLSHPLIPR